MENKAISRIFPVTENKAINRKFSVTENKAVIRKFPVIKSKTTAQLLILFEIVYIASDRTKQDP